MEEKELNIEELERVQVSPNNEVNIENAINNKELYRQDKIEELQKLKEELINKKEEKRNTR